MAIAEDMVVMDMDVDTMARGKLRLNLVILVDMVVMGGRGYYGKREAEAEPGYLRGYGGYGYSRGYGGYGYGRGYYGKREAEAEPGYLRGYGGFGYSRGYGGYGYGRGYYG